MSQALIISAAKTVDDSGCLQQSLQLEARIKTLGYSPVQLTIDPLKTPWHSPEAENHFRSGCAPIEALHRAKELINNGTDVVVISGKDDLKSGYERDERLNLMAVYGEDYPLTHAYNDLAELFIHRHGADAALFHQLAHHLFENYKCSYRNAISDTLAAEQLPDERWYNHITPLFRGVDIANPLIDFAGRVILCSKKLADELSIPQQEQIDVCGVGLGFLPGDGKQHVEDIVSYQHLETAYQTACDTAGIDFANEFRNGNALLETYTCYPVVPIAFLLASGLVDLLQDIPDFLEQHRITITGGMNLAKGPWNNPALNSLIEMYHQLTSSDQTIGAVHGNGGLGYRQGVAILKQTTDQV
ncbi:hypothetical protein [Amphritea sp. HPY]|uniref:hypothetical protein n=1 Tax=Amphritea sp. HPY TaxID=3421652 RepID=UPI003D7C777E